MNRTSPPTAARRAFFATLLLSLSGGLATAVAPGQPASEAPEPRSGYALAYDSGRDRVVLFGGSAAPGVEPDRLGDTWEFDGERWHHVTDDGPPARSDAQMVFDAARSVTVLFGGGTGNGRAGDTWLYDGTWRRVDVEGPPARNLAAMAYDGARERVVLFGGAGEGRARLADTWEWDGARWIRVHDGEGGPSGRGAHGLAFDSSSGRILLHGGWDGEATRGDLWAWEGGEWTLLDDDGPPRLHAAMGFDPRDEALVVFGGFGEAGRENSTWTWRAGRWTAVPHRGPEARAEHEGVWVPDSGFVIFGGILGQGMSVAERTKAADTWLLDENGWRLLNGPGAASELPPLPVDVALELRGHNGRSPINASPDGEWLAHTVESAETVPRGASYAYADTGFPFAEGNARMVATLSHTVTGETIEIGDPDSSSWAPVWSPDGSRVAFYSDAGGEAGLWIWERSSRRSRRVGEYVVRPFFGFEGVRWTPDGSRLLVKLLPEGASLQERNALLTASSLPVSEPTEVDAPQVTVRLSSAARGDGDETEAPVGDESVFDRRRRGMASDLALVNPDNGEAERLVRDASVRYYGLSPDGRWLAYTSDAGFVPDSQQVLFDLTLMDLDSGRSVPLGDDVRLRYGIEWSFSPDSRYLAYTDSGQLAEGEYVVVELPDGPPRPVDPEAPNFAPGEGEVPPLWSADGSRLYGVGEGALWQVDPETGEAREVVSLEGWSMRNLLTESYYSAVAFSTDGGSTLLVTARRDDGAFGIHAVRPDDGGSEPLLVETDRSWSGLFSQGTSSATGTVYFVARDQRQPGEIQSLDLASGEVRRVSAINADLDRYALGETRLLDFESAEGEPLQAALMLPPDHPQGSPLPLVVWVYGGANGSDAVNRFGLWGSMATFNMHLLASRGYAVLYPDAPVRTGRTTEDLLASVLPAVDAAVEQGWADPARVALMGQSYGSLNTLALISRSDRFAAAIITAAVIHPDLFAEYLNGTGYWEQGQGDMGGTIWEVPDRYRDNSPLFDFEHIETPLLIGQGDQDGDLVPSEAIFNALERLGKHVEYRVYANEGHVISSQANVRDFWERRLEFLAEHLRLEVAANGSVRPAGRE